MLLEIDEVVQSHTSTTVSFTLVTKHFSETQTELYGYRLARDFCREVEWCSGGRVSESNATLTTVVLNAILEGTRYRYHHLVEDQCPELESALEDWGYLVDECDIYFPWSI